MGRLSDIGKKAYVKLGDNLGAIAAYGSTIFYGGLLGYASGLFKQMLVTSKIWDLAEKLYEESGSTWSERMLISDAMEIATKTVDPQSLESLYPSMGIIAGAVLVPLVFELRLTYGPGIASRLRDTYHMWKGELQENQLIGD